MATPLARSDCFPILRTERLALRELSDDDTAVLFTVFSGPAVMRYWSTPPHRDEGETREMIASIQRGWDERDLLQWGIERRDDARLLGTVTLIFDSGQRRAELGYILGREHWGRGYAGEAQRAAIGFASPSWACTSPATSATR